MLIRGMVISAVLTGLAAGADADRNDLFTIRELIRAQKNLKVEKLSSNNLLGALMWAQDGSKRTTHCAIPLREFKTHSPDKMGKPLGEEKMDAMAKAPPIGVCSWP